MPSAATPTHFGAQFSAHPGARLRALFRFGPSRPETAPIRLLQHRIYLLPTLPGLAFAVVLCLLLVASINFMLNLGYAFTFLLVGVSFASIIHAFRNLLRLSIQTGKVEPAFCGGSAVFHLLIDNPDTRRRPVLCLSGGASPEQRGEIRFALAPAARAEIALALPALRRGLLPIGRVKLETRWPLGFVRAWSVLMPDMAALVFPAPEAQAPPFPFGAGQPEMNRADNGILCDGNEDFAGLRSYQDTDSPRHLAWKVIARGGAIMTKQFSATEGGDIFLDWHALPASLPEEARLSRLTAWVLRAEREGRRYALRLPARTFHAASGEAHLRGCLTALALHGTERG